MIELHCYNKPLSCPSTYLYEQSFCISQDKLGYAVEANKPSNVSGWSKTKLKN